MSELKALPEKVEFGLEDFPLEAILSSPYMYEQGLVKYIHYDKIITALDHDEIKRHPDCSIKIEGLERYSGSVWNKVTQLAKSFGHEGYLSVHLFVAPPGSLSFPLHKDLDDVLVYVLSGHKEFLTETDSYTLNENEGLFIPAGEYHQAINHVSSIMVSFGFESFLEQKL